MTGNGVVSIIDLLHVVHALRGQPATGEYFVDVNGDMQVSLFDLMAELDYLASSRTFPGDEDSGGDGSPGATAADLFFDPHAFAPRPTAPYDLLQGEGSGPGEPTISIGQPNPNWVFEGGTLYFPVTLSLPDNYQWPVGGISIDYAGAGSGDGDPAEGDDYALVGTPLTWGPSDDLTQYIRVDTTSDADVEPDEVFTIWLAPTATNAVVGNRQADGMIWNNDVKIYMVDNDCIEGQHVAPKYYAVGEDNRHGLVAKLIGNTRDGSATAGANQDYIAQTAILTINSNSSAAAPHVFTWIVTNNDAISEPTHENFYFDISVHGDSTAQVTIVDATSHLLIFDND